MIKSVSGATLAVLVGLTGSAGAQDWPSRPVTMVIPFAAGGPQDTIGRVVAQRMGEILHQQVVIENVGGGGGMTGSQRGGGGAPRGYSLLLGRVRAPPPNQTP